jgi:hypothetical protein
MKIKRDNSVMIHLSILCPDGEEDKIAEYAEQTAAEHGGKSVYRTQNAPTDQEWTDAKDFFPKDVED